MTETQAAGHSSAVEAVLTLPRPATRRVDFATLYDETVDIAWRVLLRLGVSSHELEDAVQDVFTIAHRRFADFRGAAKPSTWVTGIAIRVAHDYRRRCRRKPTEALEPHATRLQDPAGGPDDAAERSQAADVLLKLLSQLDPIHREVFVLAELEQHSAPDIATLIDVPVNTVYSRLRLARARFSQLVEDFHRGSRCG